MKKYLYLLIILPIIAFISLFGYVGYLFQTDNNTKKLEDECLNSNYKIKNLEEGKSYKIPNSPNQDKLEIKINKIRKIARPLAYGMSGFGLFDGCALQQILEYNVIFDNKIVAKLDGKNEWNEELFNFSQVSSFNKKNGVLDTSIEYDFEKKFLDNFQFQRKNDLILYTTKTNKELEAVEVDNSEIFIIHNNQINMINIPRNLFPSDSADRKNILDFEITGDKLEIKFGLDDQMTIKVNRFENEKSDGDYKKIWSNGNFTFCFESVDLSGKGLNQSKNKNLDQKTQETESKFQTKTYVLCQKDKSQFDKILR